MINELDTSTTNDTGNITDNGSREQLPTKMGSAGIDTDSARLGLAKEILQVIFGLDPVVMERVLRIIRGSTEAADIKTPNMRQRIGPRAMDYLRNAIDLARNEGNEYHNDKADIDMSKDVNVEPGHQHNRGMGKYKQQLRKMMNRGHKPEMATESVATFKDYLIEVQMDVDLTDPGVAVNQVRQAAKMSPEQNAQNNMKSAKGEMDAAQNADQASKTKQIDTRIAALSQQLAQLQQRRAQILKTMDQGQGQI